MNTNNIEIQGITPQSEFPICPPHHPCSQICQTDKLFLSCEQDIQKILKVIVTVSISSFKIINTPLGKKVVVHGIKHIKVISAIDKDCNCTHSACFDIPFCLFIKLKDMDTEIVKICAIVEDISVQCLKHQFLLLSIIIFACPIFKNQQNPPDSHYQNNCSPSDYNTCQNQHECNDLYHTSSNQKHCPNCFTCPECHTTIRHHEG